MCRLALEAMAERFSFLTDAHIMLLATSVNDGFADFVRVGCNFRIDLFECEFKFMELSFKFMNHVS